MPLGAFKAALMGTAGVTVESDVVLISDQDASSDSEIVFTSGIDSTYKSYIFKFYNVHSSADGAHLFVQANVSGASGYNEPVTSTSFNAHHSEDDSVTSLVYDTGWDQANNDANSGTGIHTLIKLGTGNDESGAGEFHLFNPASTTYVKNWYFRGVTNASTDRAYDNFSAGYFNVTGAITQIEFSLSTGNIDTGTFKMWGVKT